jgi:hypothetical protein
MTTGYPLPGRLLADRMRTVLSSAVPHIDTADVTDHHVPPQ